MILTAEQILELLDRLKWEPLYELDGHYMIAKRRAAGYSDDPKIARIEGALSIMLEVAAKVARRDPGSSAT